MFIALLNKCTDNGSPCITPRLKWIGADRLPSGMRRRVDAFLKVSLKYSINWGGMPNLSHAIHNESWDRLPKTFRMPRKANFVVLILVVALATRALMIMLLANNPSPVLNPFCRGETGSDTSSLLPIIPWKSLRRVDVTVMGRSSDGREGLTVFGINVVMPSVKCGAVCPDSSYRLNSEEILARFPFWRSDQCMRFGGTLTTSQRGANVFLIDERQ